MAALALLLAAFVFLVIKRKQKQKHSGASSSGEAESGLPELYEANCRLAWELGDSGGNSGRRSAGSSGAGEQPSSHSTETPAVTVVKAADSESFQRHGVPVELYADESCHELEGGAVDGKSHSRAAVV